MHYKRAYLYLFSILSDILKLLESTDFSHEKVNVAALLRHAQAEAEERCTGTTTVKKFAKAVDNNR